MNSALKTSMICTTTASLAVGVIGAAGLVGWLTDSAHLRGVLPGLAPMSPLSAVCFMLAGVSLWLQRKPLHSTSSRRRVAQTAAGLLLVVGVTNLCDYLLHLNLGIERILLAADLDNSQMAPNSAFGFALAGMSLLTIDWITARGVWPAHITTAVLAVLAYVSLVGYGYGASSMFRVSSYKPMALNTAIAFLLLSSGMLLSRPDRGMARVLFSENQGGMIARRLLPVGIFAPFVFGWFRIWGQQQEWYETGFGAALMVAITSAIFVVAVLEIAKKLNESDEENKLAVAELSRQSRQILDLYDNAPCGYHSLNRDGVYISINKTELDWLGYERDELLGKKKFSDVIVPEQLQFFQDVYQQFQEQGVVKDLEFELVRKNGTTFPVLLNSRALYAVDGAYVSSRTTLFDATERKRVEDAIRSFNAELEHRVAERTEMLRLSNAELEQKNQENEMFVYSVSHDLRSPLVNLQGFGQELEIVAGEVRELVRHHMSADVGSKTARLIDEDMRRCIHFIQTSVGRLGRIIDALLRLSRAGRVEYELQEVDMDLTVTRVIESMTSSFYDRGVTIDKHTLPRAWGDPTALEQIFANLIGNAINYLDASRPGRIEIGSLPELSTASENTYYVKDNGLGIAKAFQGKVFQALKRLHPKISGGEGVGLALVKRMVERHNGAIWFESCENSGTTFYIRLPRPLAAQEIGTPAASPPPQIDEQHASNSTRHLIG